MGRTLAIAAVLTAAGCASTSTPASQPAPTPSLPSVAAAKPQTVCGAFEAFYNELMAVTPHGQMQLIPYASAVLHAAITHPATSRRVFTDASNLAGWVGSSSFPDHATPFDPPEQRMEADCQ